VKIHLQAHQLHLRRLATIHQKRSVLNFHQLSGRVSAIGGQGAAGTQDGDFKTQVAGSCDVSTKNQSTGLWFAIGDLSFNSPQGPSGLFQFRA